MLLCVADALLTLTLMSTGRDEVNPLMAPLVSGTGHGFAYWKLGLTIFGVVVLTVLARVRLFGVVPVGVLLYVILAVLRRAGRLRMAAAASKVRADFDFLLVAHSFTTSRLS